MFFSNVDDNYYSDSDGVTAVILPLSRVRPSSTMRTSGETIANLKEICTLLRCGLGLNVCT